MTILDTDVISEVMRPNPDAKVKAWMDDQIRGDIGITAITVAEVLYGIGSLPEGKRRERLLEASASVFDEYFDGRIFSFDHRAAVHYAEIVIGRGRIGAPVSLAGAQIAAICLANGADLATRNVKDFENTGVTLIDPWTRP